MRHLTSIILLALVILPGCASIKTPTAVVTAVRPAGHTQDGARVEVTVELINPNDVPLPLLETDYTVTVDGVGSFRFEDRSHRTLPAAGTQVVVLPAAFRIEGGDLAGREVRVSGNVTYEPPGEIRRVLTDSGFPLPSTGFRAAGQLE